MAFTKFTDPADNITNQPNQPIISATALKALFDETGKDAKDYINNVLTAELESATNGDSGADNIGATALTGGASSTVQGILEELDAKAISGSGALNTHKGSADHDGRYFTEAETTALLLDNQQGNHLGTWQGYSPVQSDPGIQAIVNENEKYLFDFINVKKNGAIGDGIVDDTVALQSIINNFNNIYFPEGIYYFSKLDISSSNKKIVFGANVTLKSSLVINDDRDGYIDIRGISSATSYYITQDIARLNSYFYLTGVDSSNFTEGDIIEFEQDRPFAGSSLVTNETEHRQQNAYAILTIKSVDTGTGRIETYESIPYGFLKTSNPYIKKITAVKNIEIIGSNTQFDTMGVVAFGSFFYATYAYNITVSGFHCFNGAGKGIQTYKVNKFHISDFKYSLPTNRGSAKGDGIVMNLSGYGLVEKCYIYYPGRGIDFATCWNCSVKDSMVMQGGFSTHGLLSAFIVFENCSVYGEPIDTDLSFYAFTIGNGDYMFDEYVTLNNCHTYSGFYGVNILENSKHLIIANCEFNGGVYGISCANAENVDIFGCTFIDCDIDVSLNNVINSKIKNCTIYAKDYRTRGSAAIITLGNTSQIDIEGLNVYKNRNQVISINSSIAASAITIKNCIFRNIFYGLQLIYVNGVEIKDCNFSDRVQFYGTNNVILFNCVIDRWQLAGGTVPLNNFIIKNNIVKGLNGVAPSITPDVNANIVHDGNLYMKTIV